MSKGPLTVYFDGACYLCSFEILYYQRKIVAAGLTPLRIIDITDPRFKAESEGLDPVKVNQIMHVKTPEGEIKTAVDAFIEVWKRAPGHQMSARLAQIPIIHFIMNIGYQIFARFIRPMLPKKSR